VGAAPWQLWRTVIEDAADQLPQAHLNVLRGQGVASPAEGVLERVKALVSEVKQSEVKQSEVKQYASLFAYGSGEQRGGYAQRLQTIVAELEKAVTAGGRRTSGG
jgi:hypothetical protein